MDGRVRKHRKKPSAKQNQVTAALRDRIISGKYPPGSRIPIQLQLMEDFGMSSLTIQRALAELKQQGFLTARRRMGTFVSTTPPHLNDYALVFPHSPVSSPIWSNFYESLRTQAKLIEKETGKNIECFYAVEGFERSPDYLRLVELVSNHCLAGILFAAPPFLFTETPLLQESLPRVAVAAPEHEYLGIPLLSFNLTRTIDIATAYLISKGKKRIGLFSTTLRHVDEWLRRSYEFASQGVETREHWCFALHPELGSIARNCARMMLEAPEDRRPNGLIILDDHLSEPIEQALLNSPDPAAREIELIAQCNFPDQFGHSLPIRRIGYRGIDIIRKGLEIIDAQRAGKKVPKINLIDPVME